MLDMLLGRSWASGGLVEGLVDGLVEDLHLVEVWSRG